MSAQQQIDDPGQWRVGDYFRGEYAGHPFEGPIWSDGRYLRVGNIAIRHPDGVPRQDVTITVTRTVEPIPEPTVPWALVRFADGAVMFRDVDGSAAWWVDRDGSNWHWSSALRDHGAPVAVSLPRWSDEVDGLRARLLDLADGFDADAADIAYSRHPRARELATAHAHNLRALLSGENNV